MSWQGLHSSLARRWLGGAVRKAQSGRGANSCVGRSALACRTLCCTTLPSCCRPRSSRSNDRPCSASQSTRRTEDSRRSGSHEGLLCGRRLGAWCTAECRLVAECHRPQVLAGLICRTHTLRRRKWLRDIARSGPCDSVPDIGARRS